VKDPAEDSLPAVDDPPPTDESGDVDLEQIRHNLSLTPAQRLEQNDRWARFAAALREAGREIRRDEATA
jgi:hypothetical protein